jgi:hypothetical protein
VAKYPAGPYTYLAIVNIEQQRELFLRDSILLPHFIYDERFSAAALQRRQDNIYTDLGRSDLSSPDRTYLQRRLAQTEFLLTAARLQELPADTAEELLPAYRRQVSGMYRPPKGEYAEAIYGLLCQAAEGNAEKQELLSYISGHTTLTGNTALHIRPTAEHFNYYRRLFAEYAPWLFDTMSASEIGTAQDLMHFALEQIGADQHGWRIDTVSGISNVRVAYHSKKIRVGAYFQPRTPKRLLQVVAHEVYGHVGRNIDGTLPAGNIMESEGVAVLLEQLLEGRFSAKRSLRYLAVAAGWGTLGRPMDFRETFEIVWRAMIILSSYPEAVARHKAFQECVRAFRGGRPDIAGAVFTKDTAYFEGNIAVWKKLEERILSKAAFDALLTGQELLEV